jgi:hypothetical protein
MRRLGLKRVSGPFELSVGGGAKFENGLTAVCLPKRARNKQAGYIVVFCHRGGGRHAPRWPGAQFSPTPVPAGVVQPSAPRQGAPGLPPANTLASTILNNERGFIAQCSKPNSSFRTPLPSEPLQTEPGSNSGLSRRPGPYTTTAGNRPNPNRSAGVQAARYTSGAPRPRTRHTQPPHARAPPARAPLRS